MLATWYVRCFLAEDPHAAIRALPEVVEQARSAGQHIIFVQQGRDLLRALTTIGRYDAVAVIDGATSPLSLRPALAAEAITAAHEALGDNRSAELHDQGRSFKTAVLEKFILQLASEPS